MTVSTALTLFALLAPVQDPASAQAPKPLDEAAIGAAVEAKRERDGLRGVVVGVLRGDERVVVARGDGGKGVERALDGDTLFEIGSATKAYTGILLAIAVERGEVELDTPVHELLPKDVAMPARGRAITLLDLTTHHSSLPRLPGNLRPAKALDPYAGYGAEQLYEFLSELELGRDVGAEYEYSNLGAGLLGHVLALRAKQDWYALLRERVLEPLGMRDTMLVTAEADEPRLAQPYLTGGMRGLPWTWDCLAPCGGLRSTVNDQLRFCAANLGLIETPILAALRASHVPHADAQGPVKVALGWHVTPWGDDDPVVWHNGRTGGYASMLMIRPKFRAAVVVLTNRGLSVDELGTDLMRLACKTED